MSYSIYVDGAAPNNQHGCKRGGIGLVVFNENDDIASPLTEAQTMQSWSYWFLSKGWNMPKMVMLSTQTVSTA